ncbi:hypothetical protein [Larkinella terrae]|uniref:Uncharacterized protein n=1 Tax=Larkinella terrae TaxID=2025311 RepID=A0A7K0EJ52_9BACT|nr:hypothetical protein [Larkinella terrae]MRS61785.1 hypothetical protein [Larkinella terrae]
MVNVFEIKGTDAPLRLLFSTYAVRRFTKLMNCAPTVSGIFPLFDGETMLDAMVAMLQAGLETSSAERKQAFTMTEYEVCSLLDGLTEEEGQQITYAFMGSVLGRPASEMPDFLLEIRKKTAELTAGPQPEDAGNPEPLPAS